MQKNLRQKYLAKLTTGPRQNRKRPWRTSYDSDDGFCLSKVNFENSIVFEVNGEAHRMKHSVQTQNVFRHVVRNAEDIGMVVNAAKTTML